MKYDKTKYYHYLYSYLQYIGTEIQRDNQMRCPNHRAHANGDNNFSATYYERSKRGRPIVKCHNGGCNLNADIYDIAGLLHGTKDFIEQYKIIDKIFGSGEVEKEIEAKFSQSAGKAREYDNTPVEYVPVPRQSAGRVFSRSRVDAVRGKSNFDIIKYGTITGHWFYTDIEGYIIAVDVRFELKKKWESEKK